MIRPAAAEWDEREETPWPILQEAAKVGLYGIDMLQTMHADQTGLLMAAVNEELFWGDAGIGLAIFGSHLASAGIFATGTPEQIVQWIPRCYGSVQDVRLGALDLDPLLLRERHRPYEQERRNEREAVGPQRQRLLVDAQRVVRQH